MLYSETTDCTFISECAIIYHSKARAVFEIPKQMPFHCCLNTADSFEMQHGNIYSANVNRAEANAQRFLSNFQLF